MDQSAPVRQKYASFLIRMWREVDPAAPDAAAEWRGEIEHIQSGQRWRFVSIEALLACLRLQTEGPGQTLFGPTVDNHVVSNGIR